MPLPTPNSGESRQDFIARCVRNPTMEAEYPDNDQRVAVCINQWDDDNKTLTWKRFERARRGYIGYGEQRIRKALHEQMAPVFQAVQSSQNTSDLQYGTMESIQEQPIRAAFNDLYTTVGSAFAKRQFRELKSQFPQREMKDEADEMESQWVAYMRQYVQEKTGERIVGITETTKQVVRKVLDQAAQEGWGVEKAGRELRKQWATISRLRGVTISRTEIVSASNAGDIAGARSTGLDLRKSWLATRDDRVREDHLIADGQTVGMNEPFLVSGEHLEHPGDPQGSAGNVINCRCTQTFSEV